MGSFTPKAILWSEQWASKQKIKSWLWKRYLHACEPASHLENEEGADTFLFLLIVSHACPRRSLWGWSLVAESLWGGLWHWSGPVAVAAPLPSLHTSPYSPADGLLCNMMIKTMCSLRHGTKTMSQQFSFGKWLPTTGASAVRWSFWPAEKYTSVSFLHC